MSTQVYIDPQIFVNNSGCPEGSYFNIGTNDCQPIPDWQDPETGCGGLTGLTPDKVTCKSDEVKIGCKCVKKSSVAGQDSTINIAGLSITTKQLLLYAGIALVAWMIFKPKKHK